MSRDAEEASWVAEFDGRPDVATVSVLFVATPAQGHGVCGRLLDTAVAWVREQERLPVLGSFRATARRSRSPDGSR